MLPAGPLGFPAGQVVWEGRVLSDFAACPDAGAPLTVRAVVETYQLHEFGRLSPRTRRDALLVLESFCAYLGVKLVQDCRPFDLAAWFAQNPAWVSDWTRHRIAKTIQRPFNWASRMGLISRNPFLGYSVPTGKPGRAMTEAEFDGLLQAAGLRFGRVLRFLRYTGCRPCEVRDLRWEHIDCEQQIAVLPEHKTARTRRDKKPRVLVLPGPAIDVLIEIQEERRAESGPVFLNSRDDPWKANAFNLQMGRLRRKAGIPDGCKLYGLRHRYGTVLAASGVSLKLLAELMGHTTVSMTEHYVHLAGQTQLLRDVLGKVAL